MNLVTQTLLSVRPVITKKDRQAVLDAYIYALDKEIKSLKKLAKTVDLHKIGWLYHSMQELRLVKTLDASGVADRIKQLKDILNGDFDEDDKALASASLIIITEAGRNIRSST